MGTNTIEINGKRYDARTGALLGDSVKSAIKHQHAIHQGRAVDGFVKKSRPTAYNEHVAPVQAKKVAPQPTVNASPRVMEMVRKPKKPVAQHTPITKVASAHQPEKAKTLMRHVVHKPQIEMKKAIKKQAPSEIAAAPVSDLVPRLKTSAHNINTRRQARAEIARQSHHIQRFTSVQQNYPVARSQQTAVRRQAPAVAVTETRPAAPAPHGSHPAHNTKHTQQQSSHHTPRHADLFEAAIANAKSHEQPAPKQRRSARSKAVNFAASIAALLVIAGFVGYLNMSKIEMRVASVRAGFSAQLPGYAPTGYALDGGVKAQHGVVATTYRSGSSSYTIQQQTSDWDSQTLYDNVVAMSSEGGHKTVSGQGRTVYIYGDRAAWVNGGVLYSVQTNGDISSQELLSIATSM